MLTDASDAQLANAYAPIDRTELGRVTAASDAQPRNARSSIAVTEPGMS